MKINLLSTIKTCIIIVLLFSNTLSAQDEEFENYSFDDNDEQKLPYFALSFGGNLNFLFMKYDDINNTLGYIPGLDMSNKVNFDGPIFSWGFDFFSAMSPLINNARIGVTYSKGSQEKEYDTSHILETVTETANYNRKLSISNIGLHFDYAVVPIKSLAILPGLGVKLGNMTIEEYATLLPQNWNTINDRANYTHGQKFEYSYLAIEPQISIEYAITGFLMFRIAGSYVLPFDNPFYNDVWTINGNNSFSDVPKSVKPQGFSVSFGLYLGLFNY